MLIDKKKRTISLLRNFAPNLVVLGAQKCGTTSLHHYLGKHPDIFMSNPMKEPGYFQFEERAKDNWRRNGVEIASRNLLLEKYMLKGFNSERYFGEASTVYTLKEQSRRFRIPEKMRSQNKNIKLLYIVRNPLARIVSAYNHEAKLPLFKNLSLSERFQMGDGLLRTSLYHYQISYYLQFIPRENVEIIVFEEFVEKTQKTMNRVYEFLGLDPFCNDSNFPILNASRRGNEDSKIPIEIYDKIIGKVLKDVKDLEKIVGSQPLSSWDMSRSKWAQN